jgi:hypothetical protein
MKHEIYIPKNGKLYSFNKISLKDNTYLFQKGKQPAQWLVTMHNCCSVFLVVNGLFDTCLCIFSFSFWILFLRNGAHKGFSLWSEIVCFFRQGWKAVFVGGKMLACVMWRSWPSFDTVRHLCEARQTVTWLCSDGNSVTMSTCCRKCDPLCTQCPQQN